MFNTGIKYYIKSIESKYSTQCLSFLITLMFTQTETRIPTGIYFLKLKLKQLKP